MNTTTAEGLRLVPLGGLGEFGLNAMVVRWRDDLLLLDAGALYATSELPGVDSIVPDFRYLAESGGRLHGVVLTHGHEDHVGALPFALQAAPAPVYGSRLTLGFVRSRLREKGIAADLHTLAPGHPMALGPFVVHPIRVAHSVNDSLALAIETPAGVLVASGDFKLDPTAAPDERTDIEALAAWGERGVLVLLSDSTNVEVHGTTGCEDDVVPAFHDVFERTRGRVVVSCFATSIPRMQRVADVALARGRSVSFVGRRMIDNSETALDLGALRLPESSLQPAASLSVLPPERVLAFVSGCQGEPFSALSAVCLGEHRDLAVGPGDTVVLSARVIPGNERTVSRLIGNLYRRGCDVVHPGTARVHVSGHGSQGDLVEMLKAVRPRYLVPIHGEYRMLAQHARLAARCGMPADDVLLADDGDVLVFDRNGARKEGRAAAGRLLLDRAGEAGIDELVVRDRRQLAQDGIVVPVVLLDKSTGRAQTPPEIVTRGLVAAAGEASLMREAEETLATTMAARPAQELGDLGLLRERLRLELRRFFRRRTQRRPLVVPVVIEV